MQRFRLVCGVKKNEGKVAFLCAFPCFFTLVAHFSVCESFPFAEVKIIGVVEVLFLSFVDLHR